jgi:hypothetical protein
MKRLYYSYVRKIVHDNGGDVDGYDDADAGGYDDADADTNANANANANTNTPSTPDLRFCVLGDQNQNIYNYSGADKRFITLADEIFIWTTAPWMRLVLSQSYRVTKPVAAYVNALLGHNRIVAVRGGVKPYYIKYQSTNYYLNNPICALLKRFIVSKKYRPDEIFILAPSVKTKSNSAPLFKFENWIKREMPFVNIYIPSSDESKVSEDVLVNKLVFSTFHQAKGMERKCVFVLGFDETYFTYYNRDAPRNVLSNQLYVAMTRASECLVLCQSNNKAPLAFIKPADVAKYCTRLGESADVEASKKPNEIYDVSKLTSYLDFDKLLVLKNFYKFETIREPQQAINIDSTIKQRNTAESVSSINGVFFPLWYCYTRCGVFPFNDNMVAAMKKAEIQCAGARAGGGAGANATGYDDDDGAVDDATGYDDDDVVAVDVGAIAINATADINYSVSVIVRKHKNHEPVSIAEFTYLVAIYMCSVDNIIHRVLQISDYDWISTATTERVMARMDSLKLESPMFENRMWGELCVEGVDYTINGINDCEDTDILYEFKFTEDLADEHELQLACYMWLYDKHFHMMVDEYQREIESPTIVRVGDEIEFNHDGKTNRGNVSKVFKNGNMDVLASPTMVTPAPKAQPKRPVRVKKTKIRISATNMTANITYASTPPVYKKRRGILYNSRTDEMREIKYDFDTINEMIEMLLRIKKTNTIEITNEQFLRIIHSPYVG